MVVRTVQKWIEGELLAVLCAGRGKRGVYLARAGDVDAFEPPPRGRPPKNTSRKPAAKRPKK